MTKYNEVCLQKDYTIIKLSLFMLILGLIITIGIQYRVYQELKREASIIQHKVYKDQCHKIYKY
jgi:hypothetical protein